MVHRSQKNRYSPTLANMITRHSIIIRVMKWKKRGTSSPILRREDTYPHMGTGLVPIIR